MTGRHSEATRNRVAGPAEPEGFDRKRTNVERSGADEAIMPHVRSDDIARYFFFHPIFIPFTPFTVSLDVSTAYRQLGRLVRKCVPPEVEADSNFWRHLRV